MRHRSPRKTFMGFFSCCIAVALCSWLVTQSHLGRIIARPVIVEHKSTITHTPPTKIEEILSDQTPSPLTQFTGVVVLHPLAGFSESDFEKLVQNCSQISAGDANPHFSLLKCPRPKPKLRTPHGTIAGRGLYVTSDWQRKRQPGDLIISEFVVMTYVTSGQTYTGEKAVLHRRRFFPMRRCTSLPASFLRVISWITFGMHPSS